MKGMPGSTQQWPELVEKGREGTETLALIPCYGRCKWQYAKAQRQYEQVEPLRLNASSETRPHKERRCTDHASPSSCLTL
jgi:hypothetical protein